MHHWPKVIVTTLAIYAAVVVTPGPNFVIVTRTAVDTSHRTAVASALGVALASALFACMSLSGLSFVLLRFSWIHTGMEIAGGAYVMYLGISMWLHATSLASQKRVIGMPPSRFGAFQLGFVTNISNPKSIAFFVGLFAASLTPDTPGWVKIILVVLVFCVSSLWYTFVALCFSRSVVQTYYLRVKFIADRCVGCLLFVFGVKLLVAGSRRAII